MNFKKILIFEISFTFKTPENKWKISSFTYYFNANVFSKRSFCEFHVGHMGFEIWSVRKIHFVIATFEFIKWSTTCHVMMCPTQSRRSLRKNIMNHTCKDYRLRRWHHPEDLGLSTPPELVWIQPLSQSHNKHHAILFCRSELLASYKCKFKIANKAYHSSCQFLKSSTSSLSFQVPEEAKNQFSGASFTLAIRCSQ